MIRERLGHGWIAYPRTARKVHQCECFRRIEPGDRYLSHVAFPSGQDFDVPTRLVECATCAERYGRGYLLREAP